jgi:hypothetical protein
MAEQNPAETVEDVARFCALLADVGGRLDSLADAFGGFASHLAQVEQRSAMEWSQLAEPLRSLSAAADTATDEVAGQIAAHAATTGTWAGSRLSRVEQELGSAEESLIAQLRSAHDSLAQRFDALATDVHAAARNRLEQYASAIDAAQADLDAGASSATSTLLSADTLVHETARHLARTAVDANAAVDEAEARLDDLAATDDRATHQVAALALAELAALYDSLAGKVEQAADGLTDTASGLSRELLALITTSVGDLVEHQVQNEAAQPASECTCEVGALDGVMRAAEEETRDLPRLVRELEVSRRKLAELEEVIDAMDA